MNGSSSTGQLKRYLAYRPSEIPWLGEVPVHWEVRRLKSVLARNDAGVWGDDPRAGEGTIVLRSTEQTIDGGWTIENPARRDLAIQERRIALLAAGDLVVTKSSGSKFHIGKTSLVTTREAELEACFSNFMQRLRCRTSFYPKLAWYLLNSPVGREQLVLGSKTTTGLANLNGTVLGEIATPIPPLPEQRAIVRYLDHVVPRIRKYVGAKHRLIALLEEERQTVINLAVTRGLNPNVRLKPSGVEWLGDVPEHWEVRRLKTLGAHPVRVRSASTGSRRWVTADPGNQRGTGANR